MSERHSGVSFNHSCLNVPVHPTSKKPSPIYERNFNQKLSNDVQKSTCRKTSAVSSTNSSVDNYKSVESYLQFYEAIPDYCELHHLSDEEFYSRLKSLKITQKRFCAGTEDVIIDGDEEIDRTFESVVDRPSSHSSIDVKKYNPRDTYGECGPSKATDQYKVKKKGSGFRVSSGCSNSSSGKRQVILKDVDQEANNYAKKMKSNCWSCKRLSEDKIVPPKISVISDSENVSEFGTEDKTLLGECTCKSICIGKNNGKPLIESWKRNGYTDDGWLSDENFCSRKSKSMPSSPGWKCKVCRYATPDACDCFFDVRLRKKNLNSVNYHGHEELDDLSEVKQRESPKKQKKFCTRPVPLLSRIPLYEKIIAEQEERRRMNHNRYLRELRALVQPFSFTKREEEEKQKMRASSSHPELSACPSRQKITFKAKPIPKNLFGNYAYERMREEDLYRALKKRIRAEELLKSSSLPPSMAAREKKFRSKSLDFLDRKYQKEGVNKSRGYKRVCEMLRQDMDFEEKSRNLKNQKRRNKPFWMNNKTANSITDSSTEASPYESVSEPERRQQKRSHWAISINRSNLASILRMQTTRKRMEKEMAENLEESRLKQQARFKERLIRMTPAWRALNYSVEEDMALRVAARREEERLKKKRYEKLMGSIYGRVHQMPPLFQRHSSSANQTKRTRQEKEAGLENYKYESSYYDQNKKAADPRDKMEVEETTEKRKNNFDSTPAAYRDSGHFRTHKSSESSGSNEKSEGTKVDESDVETGSHMDEMDDYEQQQAGENRDINRLRQV